MNIKAMLKKAKITLTKFASDIGVSRPTLNAYINQYESGTALSNEKYQIVFENLFAVEEFSREHYDNTIQEFKYLINRDKLLGTFELDAKKTDIFTSVVEEMREDLYSDDCDSDLYVLINMLIRSYHKNTVFQNLTKYFLILNGRKSVDNISEDEQLYFSNYYRVFYEEVHDCSLLDKEYLDKFYKRVEDVKDGNAKKTELLKENLSSAIEEKISYLVTLGVDVEDIDMQEVLRNVKNEFSQQESE